MMRLSSLIQKPVTPDPEITGISSDSRQIHSGYLFAALPGVKSNGLDFVEDALRHGAQAVLTGKGLKLPTHQTVAHVEDENPRRMLSLLAARFYNLQPEVSVAVTGTNGKTSTVNFCQQLWALAGKKSASMGTLGVIGAGFHQEGSMTTPDPVRLHADLADLAAADITHVAMEASSHGLHQYRLDGVHLKAAGFTNLTLDHLDYHGTMKDYLASKKRLFSELLDEQGTAVINADSDYAAAIVEGVKQHNRLWFYGVKGRDFQLLSRTPTPSGQDLDLMIFGKPYKLTVPLVGAFQVMNLLCALALCVAENPAEIARYIALLPQIKGVPGRLQFVPGHKEGAAVYVDYAHTPDALENILTALRPHTKNKLVCVFGCGGDRDRSKRAFMGQVARTLSDIAIVTDDNPRSEDPAAIRREIISGNSDLNEIAGRREAIRMAMSILEPGDVLVIAGKGHEQGQTIGNKTEPFDDVHESILAMQETS